MHTRGAPNEWRTQPALVAEEVLPLVRAGLVQALDAAREAGISPKVLVLDPGYGFGKRLDENYTLLAHQAELLSLGRPLLCGLSRKSFLRRTVDHDRTWIAHYASEQERVEARETASIAALVAAILQGASIVRVHNVAAARQAASIADAILAAD
jgi:dihydropteroate synthase